jgi:hypothetical protein
MKLTQQGTIKHGILKIEIGHPGKTQLEPFSVFRASSLHSCFLFKVASNCILSILADST